MPAGNRKQPETTGSLQIPLAPLEAILGPSGGILGSLGFMLVPFWGLLVPLGLFWRRLAWLKLAPRRGEKQIFTSVRFAISIASNMDLGTSWTQFLVSLGTVLGLSEGHLGGVRGYIGISRGPLGAICQDFMVQDRLVMASEIG